MVTNAAIIRQPEGRNLDRQIEMARILAQKDKVTVIFERKQGYRTVPVLEITPAGDVLEVEAARFRVSLRDRFEDQALDALDVDSGLTNNSRLATSRMAYIITESDRDEAEYQARRKSRQQARGKGVAA